MHIRSVCTSPAGYSTPYSTGILNVTGTSQPLTATVAIQSDDACANGNAIVNPLGGYPGSAGYRYALVPAQNEPEPVTSYVRATKLQYF